MPDRPPPDAPLNPLDSPMLRPLDAARRNELRQSLQPMLESVRRRRPACRASPCPPPPHSRCVSPWAKQR